MRHIALSILLCSFSLATPTTAQTKDPGILFSTLLNEVEMAYELGTLRINYLTAVNLPGAPVDHEDTTAFEYTPKGTPGLTSVVKFDGYEEDYATMYWRARKQIGPLWTLSDYEVLKSSQPNSEEGRMEFKTPGNFTMEFYLDDKLFYKFPFTVTKLPATEGGDPLDKYFLDGPWEEYCNLFYLGGMPHMNIKLVMWLRNKDHRPTKSVQVLGILMKDGAPVAKTSEGPKELTLTPMWQRFEFPLGASQRDETGQLVFQGLKAESLLNAPGNYELMVTIDSQLYGMYSFIIEETGQFRLLVEQDSERTPSQTRIHSGKGTVWLKRNKQ